MQEITSLNSKKSDGKVSVKSHVILSAGLIYLLLPVLIFLFGWLRLFIAIPAAVILCGLAVLAVRDWKKDSYEVSFDILFLIISAVFVVVLAITCDIGEYIWGTSDHAYRRAILRDLVDYDWPVIYDLSTQTDPVSSAFLGSGKVAFSYYVTYWMVPALAGKIAGFGAGNFVVLLWSAIGLYLTIVGACFFLKKQTYAIFYALTFFSGLDFIPYLIFQTIGTEEWMWLEGYTQHIQIISNINDLMNVFNQCIPCWLITVMLLMQNKNRSVGFTGSLMFAYSPWATIGVLPIAVWALFKDKQKIRSVFTLTNIVPAVIMLFVFAPMYTANSGAVSVSGFTFTFYDSFLSFLIAYLAVLVIEIMPFALLLWKRFGKTMLYKVVIISLMVIPFYKISSQNDFTMRATMPALFVLTIFLAGAVNGYISENKKKRDRKLVDTVKLLGYFALLLCMSMVAFQMILVTLVNTFDGTERPDDYIGSFGDINDAYEVDIINEQFFVRDYEDTFFFGTMARR